MTKFLFFQISMTLATFVVAISSGQAQSAATAEGSVVVQCDEKIEGANSCPADMSKKSPVPLNSQTNPPREGGVIKSDGTK